MISLPGLTLVTGWHEQARTILLAFASHVNCGMLPNRFPDSGEQTEYNTADATLWFFEAVRALAAYTGDFEFIGSKLYPVLTDIIAWHERGTRYGIRVDDNGLLQAGEAGLQLTWTDAKVGGRPVTPRHGKPVEIQALWYNALCIMENLAQRFGYSTDAAHYRRLADRARASFCELFWNASAKCLYDVVTTHGRDAAIRPNQSFAVSLLHSMLPQDRSECVVAAAERHLLTPYGLRTLAPSDPQYHARYEGNLSSRGEAYHQGTAWPWLMGPFLTAYLRVHQGSSEARAQAGRWLDELRRFIQDEGVGQIPELFDGDAPQRGGGCIAQAWSTAELLRVMVEYRLQA